MVSIDGKILSFLQSTVQELEYWLIGIDPSHVLNTIPPIPRSQVELYLPGGFSIIGKYYGSGGPPDLIEVSSSLNLASSVYIIKTDSKLQAYSLEAQTLLQKDLITKPSPSFITLYSKTIIPLFSLEHPSCWFINSSAMYNINGQLFSYSDAGTWNSLGIKNSSQIQVDLLYQITTDIDDFAPCLEIQPLSRSYSVEINWCTTVPESIQLPEGLKLHLHKLKELVNYIINSLKEDPLKSASCYCFSNDYLKHPINVVYFYDVWNEDSEELKKSRKFIHEIFRLPEDWPLVRSTCNIKYIDGFRDVHLPLIEPKSTDVGTKTAVKGHYAYFHYAQDGFDDKGWGCAYRSLQTIISWVSEQNYFYKEVPSHYQIQKLLVEIGDKPKEFIGSKEWIGAYEVMLILDTYCNITCKILNLNSGAEFGNKGRELANHFNTEGTPVMIGGGVLAYTLLGVDYNEDTGDCRYLILDPHYVGNDNQNTILQKGWCAWKTSDIFRNDCFYNLCLPQRPKYY
jgi:Peptidase family C78